MDLIDDNTINVLSQKKKKKVECATQSNLNSYIKVKSSISENELSVDADDNKKWRLSSNLFKGSKSFVNGKRLNFEEKSSEDNVLIEINSNASDYLETSYDISYDGDITNCKSDITTKNFIKLSKINKDEFIEPINDMESVAVNISYDPDASNIINGSVITGNLSPPKINIFQIMMKQRSMSISGDSLVSFGSLKANKRKKGKKRRLDETCDQDLNDESTKNCVAKQTKEKKHCNKIISLDQEVINVDNFDNEEITVLSSSFSKKGYSINDIFNSESKNSLHGSCSTKVKTDVVLLKAKNDTVVSSREETPNEYFPSKSHVQQIPSPRTLFWNLPKVNFNLINFNETLSTNYSKFPLSIITNEKPNEFTDVSFINKIENYIQSLDNISKIYTDFPVEKISQILYSKNMKGVPPKDIFVNNEGNDKKPKKRGRPKKVLATIAKNQDSLDFANYEHREKCTMWTDKYKSECCQEIFSNIKSVDKIRKWLLNWVEYENIAKDKADIVNYDSDFCYSDEGSTHSRRFPCSGMIVKGAVGSGKTSTIYAVCLELGIDILELNASSKRTGKFLLQDLQEATQSHHVAKNNLIRKLNQNDSKNITLLLLDDVDIVFDQDEGLINALHQLLLTSKRPILLIASNVSCDYLDKFVSQYPLVKFSRMENAGSIKVWLKMMCIFEEFCFDDNFIDKLFYFCGGDVRQMILQLQFWAQNEIDIKSEVSEINKVKRKSIKNLRIESLRLQSSTYSYIVEMWKKSEYLLNLKKAKLNFSGNKVTSNSLNLFNLFRKFDTFSTCDYLIKHEKPDFHKEPYHHLWERSVMDSLELKHNHHSVKNSYFSSQIIRCLIEGCNLEKNKNETVRDDFYENKLKTWRNKILKSEIEFFNIIPLSSCTNKTSYTLDYFPTLREISRIESQRETHNKKRGNRFYSYLRTLSFTPSATTVKIANKTFK